MGVGACFPRFFLGVRVRLEGLLINNSFSVEQAISYFTVNRCFKTRTIVCIDHFLSVVG